MESKITGNEVYKKIINFEEEIDKMASEVGQDDKVAHAYIVELMRNIYLYFEINIKSIKEELEKLKQ